MPELPEIQAHVDRLRDGYKGAVLTKVTALTFTALKTHDPPADAALHTALTDVARRGKHILMHFDDLTYVVHLMQGGRLREDPKQSRAPRGGVLRWSFEDGRALLLTEAGTERRAGVWVVRGDPLAAAPLTDLGPDVDTLDADTLGAKLSNQSGRLHTVLRDQRVVAGIGRRLANEVCHRARLSPFTATKRMTSEQVHDLFNALATCIDEGLASESRRADMSSSKERPAAVHRRAGELCPTCGDTVRAVTYRKYEIDYCATCQTGGKVLADNTTSKFLK